MVRTTVHPSSKVRGLGIDPRQRLLSGFGGINPIKRVGNPFLEKKKVKRVDECDSDGSQYEDLT